MKPPRQWQTVALQKFIDHPSKFFLLEAVPGAGKTVFSALCARELLSAGKIDFVIAVAPTTAIKGDKDAGFTGDWSDVGLQLDPDVGDARAPPKNYQGAVVTYGRLMTLAGTLRTWAENGYRILVIFDEIHHVTEINEWGQTAERVAQIATAVLSMTGTPFRGDGREISFVRYDDQKFAIADHKYRYRQAITDRVCRPVQFIMDDGMAEYCRRREEGGEPPQPTQTKISEATSEEESFVSRVISQADSDFLRAMFERAHKTLGEYRSWDHDAGGLIICRPGHDDVYLEKHLQGVARMVRSVTGVRPEVVKHDDERSNDRITAFRRGTESWICAVRKISEGVDIKRLRVLVMAHKPSTELLFRQMVGRVLRVDDKNRPGDATVYMPKYPELQKWAARMEDDVRLAEQDVAGGGGGGENNPSLFTSLGSTHETGGAIRSAGHGGEEFTVEEIEAAENQRRSDPKLLLFSVTEVAAIRRSYANSAPPDEPSEPFFARSERIRKRINKGVKRLAIKRDKTKIDVGVRAAWVRIFKITGASNLEDLMKNHPIEVAERVADMVDKWLIDDAA